MALLTPPPTVAETAGFFKPFISDPVYYEDIYGTRNPDGELEELDAPDDCESDSDSEDEEALWQEGGGFSSFPSTYPSPAEPQKPVTDQEAVYPDDKETRYRIAPNINAKTSIPVSSTKKLATRKFGMFATYDPLDTTTVSGDESADIKEVVERRRRLKTMSTSDHGKSDAFSSGSRSSQSVSGNSSKTPARQKRKSRVVTIDRPKTRRLINQEIAQHARERKATLRAGRTPQGRPKAAAVVSLAKDRSSHPVVFERFGEDGAGINGNSSTTDTSSQREPSQHARNARASHRGGEGQAANAPSDKSFREIGNQEFEELVKQKLTVRIDNSSIEVDEYTRNN